MAVKQKICNNVCYNIDYYLQGLSKLEQQQVLREILQIVEGSTPIDVTRAGSSSLEREILDTSNMFFICFGVFEAEEQLLNQVSIL